MALDPVHFEKPYTQKLEGVSTVRKSTPPDQNGHARLTSGYPAMTAAVVNTQVPAISYARWFSYTTPDFVRQNREIVRAMRFSRWLAADQARWAQDSASCSEHKHHGSFRAVTYQLWGMSGAVRGMTGWDPRP